MPTWFLPPDFTFTADGPLKLGTVISHPRKPTKVLASPDTAAIPSPFPQVETLLERSHTHSNRLNKSAGMELMAKFIEFASTSTNIEISKDLALQYGEVDHEVRNFKTPISDELLSYLVNLPRVNKYINSGMFGKRSIYVITGHRIAKTSFTVTKELGSTFSTGLSVTGPIGAIPAELGGQVSMSIGKARGDSYETAPGIVFAYRVHVIRTHGSGDIEEELFAHRSGFLTGEGDDEPEQKLEVVDVTPDILDQDLEQPSKVICNVLEAGDLCIRFS